MDLLQDLSVFFRSLGGLIDGFRERAKRVNALLGDPGTVFLLVTSPEREPIDEAIFFWRKLKAARMPFGGVIVNRVHHAEAQDGDPAEVAGALTTSSGPSSRARWLTNFARPTRCWPRRDARNIERLAGKLDDAPASCCPTSTRTSTTPAGLAQHQPLPVRLGPRER